MLHEFSFPSFNQRDQVQAWIYVPAAKPVGIVQLVHGFGEHSRRYLHMIVKLLDAGFLVAADDHVGHGRTAALSDTWGDWGEKGPHTMMEDEHTLTRLVKEKYPGLPYFLFGHSMGSFIARDYLTVYGEELAAAALCGTSGVFPGLSEGMAMLQAAVDAGKGRESDPAAAGVLLGWMTERCPEEIRFGNEWICADPFVQADHALDPLDAFSRPTNNRSFLCFCQMIDCITGPAWAEKVPQKLPIYNVAGGEDPVGQYGDGVRQVSAWLEDSGHKVTTRIYEGYRHEIHNYTGLRDQMEAELIAFFLENT
ncbi:MAG: alpha/beta hydrolase [Oscillibacter sp.]|nr:alpha/beta hydrolase [Oscillibacter sp.]